MDAIEARRTECTDLSATPREPPIRTDHIWHLSHVLILSLLVAGYTYVLTNNEHGVSPSVLDHIRCAQAIQGGGIEVHRGALLFALRPSSTVLNSSVSGGYSPSLLPDSGRGFPPIERHQVTIAPNASWNYGLLPASLTFKKGVVPVRLPFSTTVCTPSFSRSPVLDLVSYKQTVPLPCYAPLER